MHCDAGIGFLFLIVLRAQSVYWCFNANLHDLVEVTRDIVSKIHLFKYGILCNKSSYNNSVPDYDHILVNVYVKGL